MRIDDTMTQNTMILPQMQKNRVEDSCFQTKLAAAMSGKDEDRLKEACQQFEAVFLNMMLQSMRATVPKSDLFGADQGKEIFESMLDQKLSENMAKAGETGLADMLYRQLSTQVAAVNSKEQAKVRD